MIFVFTAKPEWDMKPESGVRTYGGTTFFVCRGTAKPPPTVNWYINGRPLVGKYIQGTTLTFAATCPEGQVRFNFTCPTLPLALEKLYIIIL